MNILRSSSNAKLIDNGGNHSSISFAQCGFSPVAGDIVSVFDCYFDESGTHNKRVLVVAGFTSETNKWAWFSVKWNELLAEHGLSHFHMTAFMNNSGKVYRQLSVSDRKNLLFGLLRLIRETAIFGTFSIVEPLEYDRATTPKFRSDFATSYALCGSAAAILAVDQLQVRQPGNHRVGIFFEDGHKNVMQTLNLIRYHKKGLEEIDDKGIDLVTRLPDASRVYAPNGDPFRRNNVKIGAIGVGTKLDMPPLQAADILAYCLYSKSIGKEVAFCSDAINFIKNDIDLVFSDLSREKLIEKVKNTINAEENHRQLQMEAYLLSKETRREDIHVIIDEYGMSQIKSLTSKPIPPELHMKFYNLISKFILRE